MSNTRDSGLVIRHRVISASAGSGKTYQLVNRYLSLLALGVPPDSIVAVTFSRKAAAEILWKVLARLAAAAAPGGAKDLAELNLMLGEQGAPELDRAQVAGMLSGLVRGLQRTSIGTIDSFFMAVAGAFPLELGLAAQPVIMEPDSALAVTAGILNDILRAAGSDSLCVDLMQALKLASFGKEGKRPGALLKELLQKNMALFSEAPEEQTWGQEATIWPRGMRWRRPGGPPELDAVKAHIGSQGLAEDIEAGWLEFLDELQHRPAGSPKTESCFKTLIDKVLEAAAGSPAGFEIKYMRKTVSFSPFLAQKLVDASFAQVCRELALAMERTRGRYQVLRAFRRRYERLARTTGRLSYDDLASLLSGNVREVLEGDPGARAELEYRLGVRFRHWLIDEFQDTSDRQWAVLGSLIGEILQDPTGTGSLFYVGDVKQAIYGWRGGNSRLFDKILDHYDHGGELFERVSLGCSYRSGPAVIAAVNDVFGSLDGARQMTGKVQARWDRAWLQHSCQKQQLEGCVSFLARPDEVEARGGGEGEEQDRGDVLLRDLLLETRPWEKGLSCAVLVRKNETGTDLARYLTSFDIPARWEGDSSIADNSVALAALCLIRFLLHPSDRFSEGYLKASSLAPMHGLCLGARRDLLLDAFSLRGFAGLLEELILAAPRVCGQVLPFADLLAPLLAAARGFDGLRNNSDRDFVDFVLSWKQAEGPAKDCVQLLTVHKAKGMEWDQVILPELNSKGGRPDQFLLSRDGSLHEQIRWLLLAPPAWAAERDEVLEQARLAEGEDELYESICLLYVAMTRAKQALYLLGPAPDPKSKARGHVNLLRDTLLTPTRGPCPDWTLGGRPVKVLYETGARDWYKRAGDAQTPGAAPVALPPPGAPPCRPPAAAGAPSARRLVHARAGHDVSTGVKTEELFRKDSAAAGLGSAVHELFALLDYPDDAEVRAAVESWSAQRGGPESEAGRREALELFTRAVALPGVQRYLRPRGPGEVLWKEKAFEAVLDGKWYSGVFDRVSILPGQDALIVDFKTGRVPASEAELPETYVRQMEVYRAVLSRLLGLEPAKVQAVLLYLAEGKALCVNRDKY